MKQELLLESYLKDLRLSRFVQSYQSLAQEAAQTNLSYERYLLALVQEEVAHREAQRIERAIGEARFPVLKDLAEFDWSCVPSVSKPRILELATGAYIESRVPVILVGNPGLGKSHVTSGVALIITTNLRFVAWSCVMVGDERMSAALLDRLTLRATILEFVGTSYRFRQQLQRQEGKEVEPAAQADA